MQPELIERLVSVIIPCRNSAKFIETALRSVAAQTYPHIETIVVDDGSTDCTVEVAKAFGTIVRVERTTPRGAAAARNLGLDLGRGEYVQFLDADDVLLPRKIELCIEAFEAGVSSVFCGIEYFRHVSNLSWRYEAGKLLRRLVRTGEMAWCEQRQLEYALRGTIGTPAPLHRMAAVRRCSGFDSSLQNLDDVEFHFRMMLAGCEFRRIPAVLVHCLDHSTPGRLRLAADRNVSALRAMNVILRSATQAGVLSGPLAQSIADRFANYGRKALLEGHVEVGARALAVAEHLARHPRPTAVPLYNLLARLVGLTRLELGIASALRKTRTTSIME